MMKKSLIMAICHVILVSLSFQAMAAERIVVVSDRLMPYNGKPGSAYEGYAVEILRAIFESRGFEVEYNEQPWKRAVDNVRVGRADILIGAVKSEMAGFIYPKQSLGRADLCFFTNRSDWEFTGPDSLDAVKTGYIQGYSYAEWFLNDASSHPERFYAMHGENAFSRMVGMLKENRFEVIPATRAVADYYIKNNELQDYVHYAGCSESDTRQLHFALSPANTPRSVLLADILDKGLTTIRNTGQLNYLLIKYGLKDWVKVH